MPKGIPKTHVPKERTTGRHFKVINWDLVDRLLMSGCTGRQIAAYLDVHRHTLYTACEREKGITFADYLLEKQEKGNAQLLGKQFELAMRGDRAMLIWLGKNRCLQTDKIEQKVSGTQEIIHKKILCLPDNGRRTPENSK